MQSLEPVGAADRAAVEELRPRERGDQAGPPERRMIADPAVLADLNRRSHAELGVDLLPNTCPTAPVRSRKLLRQFRGSGTTSVAQTPDPLARSAAIGARLEDQAVIEGARSTLLGKGTRRFVVLL